jgi:hypothetical protein
MLRTSESVGCPVDSPFGLDSGYGCKSSSCGLPCARRITRSSRGQVEPTWGTNATSRHAFEVSPRGVPDYVDRLVKSTNVCGRLKATARIGGRSGAMLAMRGSWRNILNPQVHGCPLFR